MPGNPEYAYRNLMAGFSAQGPATFEGAAPVYMPRPEQVVLTAAQLQEKVQHVRSALSDVALAMGAINQSVHENAATIGYNRVLATLPGVDEDFLKYLDGLDAISRTEEPTEYDLEVRERIEPVLDWFDAIDDGSALRLVKRKTHESPTPSGYSHEITEIQHQILRRVGDIYNFSEYRWGVNEWRAMDPKIETSSKHFYFTRDDNGEFSPVVSRRTKTNTLSSPLFAEGSELQPAKLYQVSYSLEQFKRDYEIQQRAATTLSLLSTLPRNVGPLAKSLPPRDMKRHVQTEYAFKREDGSSFGVHLRGPWEGSRPPRPPGENMYAVYIGYSDGSSYSDTIGIDLEDWRMYRSQQERGSTAIIDEVNDALRKLLLETE